MRDWRELALDPLGGVSASPLTDDDGSPVDLFTWHGNITPPDGPYSGVVFHVIMKFPHDYPSTPPAIELSVTIPHPNVFGGYGGTPPYICLDLLKPYSSRAPYTGKSTTTFSHHFLPHTR